MKKKLLLSVLAAGLVLPSAAALAEEVPFEGAKIAEDIRAELAAKEAREAAEAAEIKDLVEKGLAENKGELQPLGNGVYVSVKEGKGNNVILPKGPDATVGANKPVAKTENKAANKAGKKALPKTSAVK
ncbi:LPKTxAVK-anchored surface protein [Gemelliphila palaticanis]|uniref:Uncharacterized protein n=1 Tax=Gemelliphila palaticanis TaxID=81950 RepID=A0ABX2T1D8_9BACL|nr:LPKTxAVK-anchored surface protein [Gemella palaticanis]MBF0716071.1 hypothetical protein [Gemella palaticanis]NYS48001.1 hypothetical protein [Gemella palaticanis]